MCDIMEINLNYLRNYHPERWETVLECSNRNPSDILNFATFTRIEDDLVFRRVITILSRDADSLMYSELKEFALEETGDELELMPESAFIPIASKYGLRTTQKRFTYPIYKAMIEAEQTNRDMVAFIEAEKKAIEAENKPKRKRPTVAKY